MGAVQLGGEEGRFMQLSRVTAGVSYRQRNHGNLGAWVHRDRLKPTSHFHLFPPRYLEPGLCGHRDGHRQASLE